MRIAISLLLLLLTGNMPCMSQTSQTGSYRFFNNFEDSALNAEWMNGNTIEKSIDPAHNFISKTSGTNPYSSGIETEIPAGLKSKNFRVVVKGSIRCEAAAANNQVVISIAKGDSSIFWSGEHIPDSTGKANEWNVFLATTLIPRSIPRDSRIKIFVWNADGKSETSIDDLDINFTEVKFPSFLPN